MGRPPLGGTSVRRLESYLLNQAIHGLWLLPKDDIQEWQQRAIAAALVGIGPRDELEGMMAAQLLAAHNAAMECYRRAMLATDFRGPARESEPSRQAVPHLCRALEALNRHRGKGQQKVTVEHVHVHAGGQAVVGMVETPGGGMRPKRRINPMQSKLPMHLKPPMRGTDEEGELLQVAGDAERPMPDARRQVARRSEGQ